MKYKELINKRTGKKIFSSHKEVWDALVKESIEIVLVYPKKELKQEYIQRYKQRGSPDSFINLISENWENWIDELENQEFCEHKQLESNQFMYSIF